MMIFCRKIIVNKPAVLKMKGPLLLACNHPNSFLDGIILDILFDEPAWALARGDVFKKPLHIKFLKAIKLMPVYRTSEGPENLHTNYKTFDACKEIFQDNGIVQIFSEGKCINEWHLRPLKKGTARLAISSWENNIPLLVLPVGINYSSFRRFGKNVYINFGDIIRKEDILINNTDGKRYQGFNDRLNAQFRNLVFEIDKKDISKQKEILVQKPTTSQRIIFTIPAALGFLFHVPLYLPVKNYVWKRCNHNDHFDSVMAAILLFSYPLYLLLIATVLFLIFKSAWVFLILPALPFTAWSYTLLKDQLDKL
ncbi:MAG: 1-acyl-sn-glycerol-3-phosphate acyltransferase [Bacteroidetes bacterium]|nr:1-acyl-sn-glycerol-3-phosphate acyltransferase [Bacteroidota bacterium]